MNYYRFRRKQTYHTDHDKKEVEEKIFSLTTRNAKLRAIPIARINSESTKRKSLDEEKRLTTTFAIWPAYAESCLVHEHDVFFSQLHEHGSTDSYAIPKN